MSRFVVPKSKTETFGEAAFFFLFPNPFRQPGWGSEGDWNCFLMSLNKTQYGTICNNYSLKHQIKSKQICLLTFLSYISARHNEKKVSQYARLKHRHLKQNKTTHKPN